MKKQYFLIVDTETTQDQLVADFGAIVVDRKGNIVAQCAVMVNGIFTNPTDHPLFFDSKAPASALWSKASSDRRYDMYSRMIANGTRMVASVASINRWLDKVAAQYNPVLTAYNLSFDLGKCANTGIDLTMFDRSFCLWNAAYTQWAHTKSYRNAVLAMHAFNAPTEYGNMTYKTNAETMTRFVVGNFSLEDEPHTALEDAVYYELPILKALLKKRSVKWLLNETRSYNWREVQVRDWFGA
jgi:hypothetical protein